MFTARLTAFTLDVGLKGSACVDTVPTRSLACMHSGDFVFTLSVLFSPDTPVA